MRDVMVVIAVTASFVVCVATLPVLLNTLLRRRAIDIPNSRSSHLAPTPRGGGLAILAAMLASIVVIALLGDRRLNLWLVLPIVIMGVTGAVDDFRSLSSTTRLGIQGATALGTTWLLADHVSAETVAIVLLGALLLVAVTNAFNFMDGINGVSGCVGLVSGVWFVWIGQLEGRPSLTYIGAAVVGACLGFLPFNFPQAQVFLGDSGSYALGFALAMLALIAASAVDPWPTAFAPLVVYCADTGATLLRRLRNGDSLLVAHRDHLYQRLARRWGSHVRASAFVTTCVVTSCAFALAGYRLGSVVIQAVVLFCLGVGYVGLGEALMKRRPRVA